MKVSFSLFGLIYPVLFITLTLSSASYSSTDRLNEQINSESKDKSDLEHIQELIDNILVKDSPFSPALIAHLSDFKYFEIPELIAELTLEELTHRKRTPILEPLLSALRAKAHMGLLYENSGLQKMDPVLDKLRIEAAKFKYKSGKPIKIGGKRITSLIADISQLARNRKSIHPHLFPQRTSNQSILSNFRYLSSPTIDHPPTTQQTTGSLPSSSGTSFNRIQTEEDIDPSNPLLKYQNFREQLYGLKYRSSGGGKKRMGSNPVKAGDSGPVDILLAGTSRFLSDEVLDDLLQGVHQRITGRDDILKSILLIFARHRQQNAVLLGSRGAGKTSIIERLAESIITDEVSKNEVTSFLTESVIIQTTSGNISRLAKSDKPAGQADAMEAYFSALSEVQKMTDRRIIVFFDEIHTLTPEQVQAIKPYIDSTSSNILLIGASTSQEFRRSFKKDPPFLRRIQDIPVREFTEDEILEIYKNSWLPILNRRHKKVIASDDEIRLMIRNANLMFPDKGTLSATFHFADDLALLLRYNDRELKEVHFSEDNIYTFLSEFLGMPVDPRDFRAMEKYRQELITQIQKKVIDQNDQVEEVVSSWMSVLRNVSSRGIRVHLLLGRSGTGKTETGKNLAINALGSPERIYIIQGSDYADADDIKLGVEFGAPGGVRHAEISSGRFMEWLDDPSGGKYAGIILIDEFDKASSLFVTRLMELFDTGSIIGGDGHIRNLNRHLFILTSNKGDKILFPPESENWSKEQIQEHVMKITKERLRSLLEEGDKNDGKLLDSHVNRFSNTTVFKPITKDTAKEIARKTIQSYITKVEKVTGLKILVDENIDQHFIDINHPQKRGARNLVRSLSDIIPEIIEQALGSLEYYRGDQLRVSLHETEEGKFKARTEIIPRNSSNDSNPEDRVIYSSLPQKESSSNNNNLCLNLFSN